MKLIHTDDFLPLEVLKYYFEVDKKSGEIKQIRDFRLGKTFHIAQDVNIETDLSCEKVITIVDSEGNERKYSAAKIIFALAFGKEVSDKQKTYFRNKDRRTLHPDNIVIRNW